MSGEVVELCREMVAIGSINPQDRPVAQAGSNYGEEQMAAFVHEWLGKANLNAERVEVAAGRENVVAVAEGVDRSKTLLLSGHMDTVDVQDMTIEPFDPQVTGGKVYGRGSCDTKGPLAAMMIAFRDRVKSGPLPCNLAFVATCDEEYGMSGARHYAANTGEPLAGAVFAEPTGLTVVVAHKGVVRLQLRSQGKSCHSSAPQLGKNAIYAMARAVTVVEEYAAEVTERPKHPLLETEVLALTVIGGGQQVNVIPDSCSAVVDWRILPGRSAVQCRDELAGVLAERLAEPITVDLVNGYAPVEMDSGLRLIGRLLDATEKAAGIRRTLGWSGATDASSFADRQIVTPILGPGGVAQAHTQDEYIEVQQLEKGLEVYGRFLGGDDWGI